MVGDNTTVKPVESGRRRGRSETVILEVVEGSLRGRVFELTAGQTVIGKGEGVEVRLPDSGVSRTHAKVIVGSDGGINVVDLASTNGTFVNGTRIDIAVLSEGDRIGLGPDATVRLVYRTDSAAPDELSDRQLEVARLVANGMTNAEIAAALSISPRTVTSHLDHIYTRLGIGSRAALTRWVMQRGLGG